MKDAEGKEQVEGQAEMESEVENKKTLAVVAVVVVVAVERVKRQKEKKGNVVQNSHARLVLVVAVVVREIAVPMLPLEVWLDR